MFQQPGYTETVSMRLSQVLSDIGVDERMVLKRRKTWLLMESIRTKTYKILDKKTSSYYLGSQCEGITTLGLESDVDLLLCKNNFNVIQDWSDWKHGDTNFLMIQDENVSPGYCLLQRLRDDVPLPYDLLLNENYYTDRSGRTLFKNTVWIAAAEAGAAAAAAAAGENMDRIRHGPALAAGKPGFVDTDVVVAMPCKTWPIQARQWLDHHGVGQWPSDDMIRYCSNTGCFVVGVGSKAGENEELEWRISTSLAERCLMFNLNITQIRCYILMKMVLKTFIKPYFEDTISSFMCKTVLFHCIADTHSHIWRENNILICLSLCIFVLYNSISNENCPHFFIPGNNLMRGHVSHETKPYILQILRDFINSEGRALLGIECDGLGARLQLRLMLNICPMKTNEIVSGQLLHGTAVFIKGCIDSSLFSIGNSSHEATIQALLKYIFKLANTYVHSQRLDKTACYLLAQAFCTTLGSVLASLNIQQDNVISAEALTWISLGLDTDIAFGKLKLASMLYCTGDIQRTETVLRDIDRSYDLNTVEPICYCHKYIHQNSRQEFNAICDHHNEEAIQYTTASCVQFLPCEINCVPTELRHEMFRSTDEDFAYRNIRDIWMKWAVVDALPFLYFLQYKIYSHLGRQDDKQVALSSLVRTIDQEPNLGHRETALNLLGQCMEQEDRARDALQCYFMSLNLRERNNAAKFHISSPWCSNGLTPSLSQWS